MNMIYNSPHFCVVEFTDYGVTGKHASGGFEIMDKSMRREIFLGGEEAERFREQVSELIDSEPSHEDVDAFLYRYSALMTQPLTLH